MVFFDQSLEEWINKKSIHRYDVLLPVAFKDIVPPLITILLSNFVNPPSASGFVIEAGITLPDVLASLHCLRVPGCILFKVTYQTVNGSDPVYLSSYFHTSRWRASDHPSLTNWLFHLTTSLLSAGGLFQSPPPISGTVSLHISHQHCCSRFSGSVSRVFSSGAPLIWHSKFTLCMLWT